MPECAPESVCPGDGAAAAGAAAGTAAGALTIGFGRVISGFSPILCFREALVVAEPMAAEPMLLLRGGTAGRALDAEGRAAIVGLLGEIGGVGGGDVTFMLCGILFEREEILVPAASCGG